MKKAFIIFLSGILIGCTKTSYQTITAKQAKEMIGREDVVIIDVREENEYLQGHISHAILIPLETISKENLNLPSKTQTLLIYCRSGRRSQQAAQQFVQLGYQNVYDFGGIIDWPYEIIK